MDAVQNQLGSRHCGILLHRKLPLYVGLSSVLLATLLIVRTYPVFDQTYDESAIIAGGLEWLDHGTFHLDPITPPLVRVAAALPSYLRGARIPDITDASDILRLYKYGNTILDWNGSYETNLTLARLCILPFFWLTCFLTWRFMSQYFSQWHSAVAVFLLAFCPVVLGHSGLATTDTPSMAMFLWSVLALCALLQRPTRSSALLAGFIIGLGALTKLTEIPFLLVTGGALWLDSWATKKRLPVPWKLVGLGTLALSLTIWSGYRFRHGPILRPELLSPNGLAHLAAMRPNERAILLFPWVPANDFFKGLTVAYTSGRGGRPGSYLLGQIYSGGRWDFFPVAILAKTPIPLLLLCLAAVICLVASGEWRRSRGSTVLLAGFLGPLLVGMMSNLNLGLHHILPIYPFVAMLGALAAARLWRLSGRPVLAVSARAVVLLLIGWNLETCLHAAPDFFAYFNEPAAPHDSYILIGSDLDWGQDLKRLSSELQRLHVQHVSLAVMGEADLSRAHLPRFDILQPWEKPGGWIAIGEYPLMEYKGYRWLEAYPYTRVGRSIRLYHLPDAP